MALTDDDLAAIEDYAKVQADGAGGQEQEIAEDTLALVAEVRRLRVGLDAAFSEATKEFEDSWEGHRAGLEDAIDIFARHVGPVRPSADTGTGRWERNEEATGGWIDFYLRSATDPEGASGQLIRNPQGSWRCDVVTEDPADLRAAARIIENTETP